MKLDNYRRDYKSSGLRRDELDEDPMQQFTNWLQQAIDDDAADPTAMILATVSDDGSPWQRTVLLKGFDQNGFVFYTNLGSRKANEIAVNDRVSLLFRWLELNRQVIVSGRARKLSAASVLSYFMTRPRESQLAAWASRQSHPLSSRQILEQKFVEIKHRFAAGEVPLPSFWGGYCVEPLRLEFWQGRPNRLHDRFLYEKNQSNEWSIARLAP